MGSSLLTSYRFEVEIRGQKLGFSSIAGLKLAAAFEPLAVGGMNGGPLMLPVPVKDPGRLTLERGAGPLSAMKDFIPGKRIADRMQVNILNEMGKPGISFTILSPVLESVELSKLDAAESAMLIDSLSVIYGGITRE